MLRGEKREAVPGLLGRWERQLGGKTESERWSPWGLGLGVRLGQGCLSLWSVLGGQVVGATGTRRECARLCQACPPPQPCCL